MFSAEKCPYKQAGPRPKKDTIKCKSLANSNPGRWTASQEKYMQGTHTRLFPNEQGKTLANSNPGRWTASQEKYMQGIHDRLFAERNRRKQTKRTWRERGERRRPSPHFHVCHPQNRTKRGRNSNIDIAVTVSLLRSCIHSSVAI